MKPQMAGVTQKRPSGISVISPVECLISRRVLNAAANQALHCPKVLTMNDTAFKLIENQYNLVKLIFYGNKRALRKNTAIAEGLYSFNSGHLALEL